MEYKNGWKINTFIKYLNRLSDDYLYIKARQLIKISKMREIVKENKEWLIIDFSDINILIEEIKIILILRIWIRLLSINFMKKYDKEHVENIELYTMFILKELFFLKWYYFQNIEKFKLFIFIKSNGNKI